MAGPFAGKMNPKIRYALLAGAMLPLVGAPQSSMAEGSLVVRPADRAIILAQAANPDDARSKAQPKGPPPKGPQNTAPPPPPKVIQQQQQPGAQGTPPARSATPPAKGPQIQQQQFGLPKGPQPPARGPQVGTAPVTLQQGHVEQLRSGRVERKEANGRVVITEPGGRFIVREGGGRAFIRHDETARFRLWGPARVERRGAEQFAYVGRPGGYQIVTVTGPDGRVLRRMRRGPDGRDVILFTAGAVAVTGVVLALAAPRILMPREHYIVDVGAAPPALLYETLDAPLVEAIERPYTLDEIRFNVALRDRTRRLDLDSVTFDTGSWEVTPEQYPKLEAIAAAMRRVLDHNPNAIFFVEGHTDRVGNDVDNLSLSDRRAESVAVVLTEQFQIPPENLVTQGYGEQFPKVDTDGPSRENRRVAIRNITRLLAGL